MKKYVIIVAGGVGKRMQTEIPKQFMPLKGKPVLMRSFESFIHSSKDYIFYLVLPEFHMDTWKALCRKHDFKTEHRLVNGGAERFFSVKNALDEISTEEDSLIAVHDGVRPLISTEFIDTLFRQATEKGNAVPAIPPAETLRQLQNNSKSKTVDRKEYRLIQTPQVFHLNELKEAYTQDYQKAFTDDASVVEAAGVQINLVEGRKENIKITLPVDLKIAEALL